MYTLSALELNDYSKCPSRRFAEKQKARIAARPFRFLVEPWGDCFGDFLVEPRSKRPCTGPSTTPGVGAILET